MDCRHIFNLLIFNISLFPVLVWGQSLPKLEVSDNHRYLVQADGTEGGKPFFYLGDTAWELYTRLTKPETEKYFQVRKDQGFNVLLVDAHNEIGINNSKIYGIEYPNRDGYKPFVTGKEFTPEGIVEGYWSHVDWVIGKAEEYGLYMATLPYFGNRYVQKERDCIINSAEMAYKWGYFLGNRYKNKTNIIWVLGGDFEPFDYKTKTFDKGEYEITIATAEGIADGINGAKKQFDGGKADYSTSLMTYHINEGHTSSEYFHQAGFLDFNVIQSGHNQKDVARNYQIVREDYNKIPVKPTIDLESWYEYIKVRKNGKWEDPRCTDFDVRRNAYRSILAGGFGYCFGNNNVWMFFRKNENYDEKYNPTNDWDSNEGIYSEGSKQMIHVKNLFLSRPFYYSIPSNDLVTSGFGGEVVETHIQASLGEDHDFAVIYIPTGQVFNIDLTQINGNVNCWWYNPVNGNICDRNGKEINEKKPFQTISREKKTQNYQFTSPTNQDWVLVLDDASKKLPIPGSVD